MGTLDNLNKLRLQMGTLDDLNKLQLQMGTLDRYLPTPASSKRIAHTGSENNRGPKIGVQLGCLRLARLTSSPFLGIASKVLITAILMSRNFGRAEGGCRDKRTLCMYDCGQTLLSYVLRNR